ncbi:MAG: protein-L-isoaspartate O-methyltransferase [Alphaproteobacteria bacterium]|nr:protein-L-isoaspartate O-methyltransferase [Alphaproteobacteria bacterium]MDE1985703.1 protein-L-isoaspartate O-methyltransferase [Alphaproteobacteria bacterium]MDE2161896.1 protein-L-isoaspartate O-methyltransferase [Alphaproteobacteria bacterium]MDE2264967.1 protein-L-isoaspartate O-methyltransferase [Alphaproteobacteria bacterium]
MPDYVAQRANMVETQLSTNDVGDSRIQDAMGAVQREQFVPASKRAMAYCDLPIEVAPGRYLLDPRSFAKLLVLADLKSTDRTLDVGCTTGYSTAVLARLVKSVVALEQDAALVRLASDLLPAMGVKNATVVQGSMIDGVKANAPYDAIIVNGGIEEPPQALLSQLVEGGRLVAVIQQGAHGCAHLFVREKGRIGSRVSFDASVPVLAGFKKAVGFVF